MNSHKAETPVLWPPHAKSWLIGNDYDVGRDWGQEKKGTTEDEMVGWHHRLDGREFEGTPGVGDGQGGLACCDSWGRKESTWLSNWSDLIGSDIFLNVSTYLSFLILFISLVYLSLHFVSLFFLYKDLFKNISSSAVPLVTNFLNFYFNPKIFNFAFTFEDCFCWVYNSEMILLFSA